MSLHVSEMHAEFIHGLVIGEQLGYVLITEKPESLAHEEGSWAWRITDKGIRLVDETIGRAGKALDPDDVMYAMLVALGRVGDEFDGSDAWTEKFTQTVIAVRQGR